MIDEQIGTLKEKVLEESSTLSEFIKLNEQLHSAKNVKTKENLLPKLEPLKIALNNQKEEACEILNKISLSKPLESSSVKIPLATEKDKSAKSIPPQYFFLAGKKTLSSPMRRGDLTSLEKSSLKRMRKKEAVVNVEDNRPSKYVNVAVRTFYTLSRKLVHGGVFKSLKPVLVRANMAFIPENYVSVILFTTLLSIIFSILLFSILLFFNISTILPILTPASEPFQDRILKFLGIIFVIPLGTFLMMYFYPFMERKSIEGKINQELPFVTIHMSSISGAMKDPSKMFEIIILTGEYPSIKREFSKVINEINLYGYDLVSALRNSAFNCPSERLAELYNGISTTISSGGNLSQFFEKRAETLLFDYKIEREKYNKSTETFMDIYLSVVIAGPMILMLLMIIMRVSGLGISLSTPMISLITILGVTLANIFFLVFLYLKQPAQ